MKFGRIDIHKLTTTVINFVMLLCLSCAISSVLLTSVSFAQTPQVEEWHYTLRPGDNLQKVSQGLLNRQHTWTDLIRYNKI
ncbi:hypothetical protein, partial [Oleiphilus sp. HI0132]